MGVLTQLKMSSYHRFEDEVQAVYPGAAPASMHEQSLMDESQRKQYGLRPTPYGHLSRASTQGPAEGNAVPYAQAPSEHDFQQPSYYPEPGMYEQAPVQNEIYYPDEYYYEEEESNAGCLSRNRSAVSRLTFFLTLFSLICSCLSLLAATDSPYLIKTFAWGVSTNTSEDGQCTETLYIGLEHVVREVECKGDSVTVEVSPATDSVDEVKARVEKITGIPADEQRLVIEGHLLESGKALKDYAIESTKLVFKLKGDADN